MSDYELRAQAATRETAVQHNAAVIITGHDETLKRALAAGFIVVGDWSSQGPSPMGGPPPIRFIGLRKTVPTPLAGVVDYYKGERAPEEWFK
jgi:hypothetical protein